MEINELDDEEALALVGLLREVIQADDVYSEQERAVVARLSTAMGDERFEQTMTKAAETFVSRASLKQHVKGVTKQEARELIFEVLRMAAEADGLTSEEEKPLRWLASWWELGDDALST